MGAGRISRKRGDFPFCSAPCVRRTHTGAVFAVSPPTSRQRRWHSAGGRHKGRKRATAHMSAGPMANSGNEVMLWDRLHEKVVAARSDPGPVEKGASDASPQEPRSAAQVHAFDDLASLADSFGIDVLTAEDRQSALFEHRSSPAAVLLAGRQPKNRGHRNSLRCRVFSPRGHALQSFRWSAQTGPKTRLTGRVC
jgi:hypothetical protein